MLLRSSRLLALLITLTSVGTATPAQACCLFGGGGWGAWRPLSWTGFYGPRTSYWGGGWNSGWASTPCAGGACGVGTDCNSCGVQASYAPGCNTCGTTGYCGDNCAVGWNASSQCCTQYTPTSNEPTPDPTMVTPKSPPGTDNFRSSIPPAGGSGGTGTGGSSIPPFPPGNYGNPTGTNPPSSIPERPAPGGSSIPADRNPSTNYEYNQGRDLNDPNNAPRFELPKPIEGPFDIEPGSQPIKIDPLELDQPIVRSYRPSRERVRAWSNGNVPQVAAQTLPTSRDILPTPATAVASK